MIRHVEHFTNGRNHFLNLDLNALFERYISHATALTAAFHSNVGPRAIHIDEADVAPMSGHGWVYAGFQQA